MQRSQNQKQEGSRGRGYRLMVGWARGELEAAMTKVICLPGSDLSSRTFPSFLCRPQNKIPSPPGTNQVKAFTLALFLQLLLLTLTLAVLCPP